MNANYRSYLNDMLTHYPDDPKPIQAFIDWLDHYQTTGDMIPEPDIETYANADDVYMYGGVDASMLPGFDLDPDTFTHSQLTELLIGWADTINANVNDTTHMDVLGDALDETMRAIGINPNDHRLDD